MRATKEELYECFEQGLSVLLIAKRFGYVPNTVRRYLKDWQRGIKNGGTDVRRGARSQAYKLFDMGYSNKQVGEIVGRSMSRIGTYRHDWRQGKKDKELITIEENIIEKHSECFWSGCAVFTKKTRGFWRE